LKHGKLVAQDEDLDLFGGVGSAWVPQQFACESL
jgi:hypothetical protein